MRLILRKAMSTLVLLSFVGLCFGLFAFTGGGVASAKGLATCGGSDFKVNPCTITETTNGMVSFTLIGQNLDPKVNYTLLAPTLANACNYDNVNGSNIHTDFAGRFNFPGFATGCIRGHFLIQLQLNTSPFTTFSVSLTIKAP